MCVRKRGAAQNWTIPRLCRVPRPRPDRDALACRGHPDAAPRSQHSEGSSAHMISWTISRRPLSTLHEPRCRCPCKTRFRLAHLLPGGSSTPWTNERFRFYITSPLPGLTLTQIGRTCIAKRSKRKRLPPNWRGKRSICRVRSVQWRRRPRMFPPPSDLSCDWSNRLKCRPVCTNSSSIKRATAAQASMAKAVNYALGNRKWFTYPSLCLK
jgi:hypothetical protein